MSPPSYQRIPTEIEEKRTQYLDLEDFCAYRLACRQADRQSLDAFGKRYFSWIRTSLMCEDLSKLETVSKLRRMRGYLERIFIEDDRTRFRASDKRAKSIKPMAKQPFDPNLPLIWPRDCLGFVKYDEIGIKSLRTMLKKRSLTPSYIQILDHLGKEPRRWFDCEAVGGLAKRILIGTGIAIIGMAFHCRDPYTDVAELTLSPEHQDKRTRSRSELALLENASLLVHVGEGYWPLKVLGCASNLGRLELTFRPGQSAKDGFVGWKVEDDWLWGASIELPKLRHLGLLDSGLSPWTVRTILIQFKGTLRSISFRNLRLSIFSKWQDLLCSIADDLPRLDSFELRGLRESWTGDEDFSGLWSGGLQFNASETDLEHDRWRDIQLTREPDLRWPGDIQTVHYEGPCASAILKLVASGAQLTEHIPTEGQYPTGRRRSCITW